MPLAFEQTRALANALEAAEEDLARRAVDLQYRSDPRLEERWGKRGYEKSLEDARYNVSVLVESVAFGDPELFARHVRWLRGVLAAAHVEEWVLADHLTCLAEVLREVVPEHADELSGEWLEPSWSRR